MDEKEISDLSQYFRLTRFRDEGDLFLEEYQELEDIIRRNPMAQLMEEDHFQYLRGLISDEEYEQRMLFHQLKLHREVAKSQAKKTVLTCKKYIDCDGVILDTETGLFDEYYRMLEKDPNYQKRTYLQEMNWKEWLKHAAVLDESVDILKSYDPKNIEILTTVHSIKEAAAKIDYFRQLRVQNNVIAVPAGIPKSQVVCALNNILVDNSDFNLMNWKYNYGYSFSYGFPETEFPKITSLEEVLNPEKLEKRLVKIFEKTSY